MKTEAERISDVADDYAFPRPAVVYGESGIECQPYHGGMSYREWLIGQIAASLAIGWRNIMAGDGHERCAEQSIQFADEIIKRLARE